PAADAAALQPPRCMKIHLLSNAAPPAVGHLYCDILPAITGKIRRRFDDLIYSNNRGALVNRRCFQGCGFEFLDFALENKAGWSCFTCTGAHHHLSRIAW